MNTRGAPRLRDCSLFVGARSGIFRQPSPAARNGEESFASAVIHANAADLASQLEGYWKPDMEKIPALAKKANRLPDPMAQAMMGKMVFEFQKDSAWRYVRRKTASSLALSVISFFREGNAKAC